MTHSRQFFVVDPETNKRRGFHMLPDEDGGYSIKWRTNSKWEKVAKDTKDTAYICGMQPYRAACERVWSYLEKLTNAERKVTNLKEREDCTVCGEAIDEYPPICDACYSAQDAEYRSIKETSHLPAPATVWILERVTTGAVEGIFTTEEAAKAELQKEDLPCDFDVVQKMVSGHVETTSSTKVWVIEKSCNPVGVFATEEQAEDRRQKMDNPREWVVREHTFSDSSGNTWRERALRAEERLEKAQDLLEAYQDDDTMGATEAEYRVMEARAGKAEALVDDLETKLKNNKCFPCNTVWVVRNEATVKTIHATEKSALKELKRCPGTDNWMVRRVVNSYDDKIDELETAADFLRHKVSSEEEELEKLKKENIRFKHDAHVTHVMMETAQKLWGKSLEELHQKVWVSFKIPSEIILSTKVSAYATKELAKEFSDQGSYIREVSVYRGSENNPFENNPETLEQSDETDQVSDNRLEDTRAFVKRIDASVGEHDNRLDDLEKQLLELVSTLNKVMEAKIGL